MNSGKKQTPVHFWSWTPGPQDPKNHVVDVILYMCPFARGGFGSGYLGGCKVLANMTQTAYKTNNETDGKC